MGETDRAIEGLLDFAGSGNVIRILALASDGLVVDLRGVMLEIEARFPQDLVEFIAGHPLALQRDQAPEDGMTAVDVQAHADLPHAKPRIEPCHQVLEGQKLVPSRTEKALGTWIVVSMTPPYRSRSEMADQQAF